MSSKKSSARTPQKAPGLLPLPGSLLSHHAQTLFPLMQQWVEQKRVPPVLLMTGPTGIGKRHMAHFIAQWLQCQKQGYSVQAGIAKEAEDEGPSLFGGIFDAPPTPAPSPSTQPEPCGECPSCLRALHQNWIDFIEVQPEGSDEKSASIKIDQFREIKSTLGFGAHEADFKIILISHAESMTSQAANSLLKILEEPPPGWVFFLTAGDASLLLPTLVSRCQRIRLRPLEASSIKNLLKESEVAPERLEICSRLAFGSWQRALTLAQDENWERRGSLFRFLERPQAELSQLVDWAAQDVRHFSLMMDQLESLAADFIYWSLDSQNYQWINQDGKRSLQQHAETMIRTHGSASTARARWIEIEEKLCMIRQRMNAPLNRKLLAQEALSQWVSL